jgi:hypothetical protein
MNSLAERLLQAKSRNLLAAILIYLLVFLMMPSPIEHYFGDYRGMDDHFWDVVSAQINGTYRSEDYPESSHAAKLTFRLTPVQIGRMSFSEEKFVQVLFIYGVQLLMGLVFTFLLVRWLADLTGKFYYAALMTLGFMFTHVGSSFTYDFSFFFDGIAFFFLGVAFFSRSNLLYFAGLTGSLWTDERAIIGIAGVWLFKLIQSEGLPSFRALLADTHSLLTLGVLALYGAIRFWLTYYGGMAIPVGDGAAVGLKAWFEQINHMPIAWLLSFKMSWYYLIPLMAFLWQKNRAVAYLSAFFIALAILSTGLVVDIMRSTSYLFPFLLCGIYASRQIWAEERNAWAARFVSIANVVMPNYRNFEFFYLILPLPLRMLKWLL